MFVMLSCSHDSLHNGGEKYHNRSQFRANDGLERAAHLCDEIDVAADVAGKENHGDEQGKTGCHVAEAARLWAQDKQCDHVQSLQCYDDVADNGQHKQRNADNHSDDSRIALRYQPADQRI